MIAVAAIWLSSKRVFASGGQADCAKIQKSTNIGPWRSLASALAWGARGPGFKSRRPDQLFQTLPDSNGGSQILAVDICVDRTCHGSMPKTGATCLPVGRHGCYTGF